MAIFIDSKIWRELGAKRGLCHWWKPLPGQSHFFALGWFEQMLSSIETFCFDYCIEAFPSKSGKMVAPQHCIRVHEGFQRLHHFLWKGILGFSRWFGYCQRFGFTCRRTLGMFPMEFTSWTLGMVAAMFVFHSGFCVKMAWFWLKTMVPPRINTLLPNMAKFCSRRGSTVLHSHIRAFWLASIKTYPLLLCEWIACQVWLLQNILWTR